jgi:hypothetical protein
MHGPFDQECASDAAYTSTSSATPASGLCTPASARAGSPSDDEVVSMMLRNPVTRKLFSVSFEADASKHLDVGLLRWLCFYCGNSEEQIVRVFRRSARWRESLLEVAGGGPELLRMIREVLPTVKQRWIRGYAKKAKDERKALRPAPPRRSASTNQVLLLREQRPEMPARNF